MGRGVPRLEIKAYPKNLRGGFESMKNLKKLLAVIVSICVLATFTVPAFAAETAKTDAEICADLGVLKGEGSGVTADYLAQGTTRLQAAILYLRLIGKEAEALAFTGTETFEDADEVTWAGGKAVLAYLKAHPELGWVGDGKKFDPNGAASAQMMYKVALEALGYKQGTDFQYADTITFAASLGLTKVAAIAELTNDNTATALIEILKGTVKGGTKTLAEKLVADGIITAAAAEAAGLYTTYVALDVKSVVAAATTKVDITLNTAAVKVDLSKISIKDAAGADVAISGYEASSDMKLITLTTAALTTAAKYTITIDGVAKDFVGAIADKDAPVLSSAAATSNTTVEVVFTDGSIRLDKNTATDIANYSINNGLTITAASLSGLKVTLTTSSQTVGTVYTLTVNNVKDIAGNAMTAAKTATFAGKAADTAAPAGITASAYSNTQVRIDFDDTSKIDEASAEAVENYTIAGLTVTSAELLNSDTAIANYAGTKYKSVILTTTAQTAGTVYTVSVLGVKDVAGNAITSAKTATFAGKAADVAAPSQITATAINNTLVRIDFTDASNIDEESAENIANYTIAGLTITGAQLINTTTDRDTYSGILNKSVLLTTSAQTTGTVYTASVLGVKDIAGNAITSAKTATFAGKAADVTAPTVSSILALSGNKLKIIFSEAMDGTSVQTLTNYSISTIGYPVSVDSWTASTRTLVLNTAAQGNGTVYTVTINNVKDMSGNVIAANTKKDFAGIGSALDAPAISTATALNNKMIDVVFNKDVTDVDIGDFVLYKGSGSTTDILAGFAGEAVFKVSSSEYIIYLGTGASDKLSTDVYTLKVTGSIKDFADVAVSLTDSAKNEKTFGGIDTDPAKVEIIGVAQVNARQFIITFNQKVAVGTIAASDISLSYNGIEIYATAAARETDKTKVKITFGQDIVGEKVGELRVRTLSLIKDLTGQISMVANDTSNNWYDAPVATVSYTTETLKVESVTMVDEQTLEIAFNQDIVFTTNTNPGAGTDDNFMILKVNGGSKVAGYDLKYAKKTGSNKVQVYFTAGSNFAEGIVYSAEIADNAAGDALFTSAISGLALDAATAANAKGTFGYNPTVNEAPYLVSVTPMSTTRVSLTFSEDISIAPTTDGNADTNIAFFNGTTDISASITDLVSLNASKKVYYADIISGGIFEAGTSYTVKIPYSATKSITDTTGIDVLKSATSTDAEANKVTFGGTGTLAAPVATLTSNTIVVTGLAGATIKYTIGASATAKADVIATGTPYATAITDGAVSDGQYVSIVVIDTAGNSSYAVYKVAEATIGTITAVTLQ